MKSGRKEMLEKYTTKYGNICVENNNIDTGLYAEYGVKRGLRDMNGEGVLTGLTNISFIKSSEMVDGKRVPCEGQLLYRGYDVIELVKGFEHSARFGFEEIAYLLLYGELPKKSDLAEFKEMLGMMRTLPTNFTRDVIMKATSKDIMNSLTKSVLTLASYDKHAADLSIPNVLRQCMMLISVFPMLSVYGYQAYNHYDRDDSLYIHRPELKLSTAQNILRLLRPDMKYTELEAKVLDIALVLHMEHGGGNNSTFTTRVVTSSGSDTYSTMAAAMSSLKGPKHGGANIKVMEMMADIRTHVKDYADKEELAAYLSKILDGEAFDGRKLIYGMGHAVYTLSDPRERVFKHYVEKLAEAKGRQQDMMLYQGIEELAPVLIGERRRTNKGVSPNVDFYSGFVYDMLGIPQELYTAMFAVARIVGWSAHRIEELICTDKIIRPAYMSVMEKREI